MLCGDGRIRPSGRVKLDGRLRESRNLNAMTVAELLKRAVDGNIAEAQFMEEFSRLLRGGPSIPGPEAQCLSELVEDVNMAEHIGPLFDDRFVRRVRECLRLLEAGAGPLEIKNFFRTNSWL